MNYVGVAFEMDCMEVINAWSKADFIADSNLQVRHCKWLSPTFNVLSISHVSSNDNRVTHSLDKPAKAVGDVRIWFQDFPDCIKDSVEAETK